MKASQFAESLTKRFNQHELGLVVHKAEIRLQLKNLENGEIELHEITYTAKDAVNLEVKRTS